MRAAPCHCERPLGRAAINRIGIPCLLIATLALLACNDKRSATKVAPPIIYKYSAILRHCELTRSNQQARNPLTKNPQKKRAQSYGEATAQRRFEYCNL